LLSHTQIDKVNHELMTLDFSVGMIFMEEKSLISYQESCSCLKYIPYKETKVRICLKLCQDRILHLQKILTKPPMDSKKPWEVSIQMYQPPHWFNLMNLAGSTKTRKFRKSSKRANYWVTMLVKSIQSWYT